MGLFALFCTSMLALALTIAALIAEIATMVVPASGRFLTSTYAGMLLIHPLIIAVGVTAGSSMIGVQQILAIFAVTYLFVALSGAGIQIAHFARSIGVTNLMQTKTTAQTK